MIYSVIGANYGDEGKGLATDFLAKKSKSSLVVRHNGGAQSGHTVEDKEKRFVFHEISSGSFRGADTYWAESFFPDLFKLEDEMMGVFALIGKYPSIYASSECCITTVDDVLINMLLESSRGDKRHGSCGMGINEALLRKQAGYSITMKEVLNLDAQALYEKMCFVREKYTFQRLKEIENEIDFNSEYLKLLNDSMVLLNYAKGVAKNRRYISGIAEPENIFKKYENIIFESGQGLRLDSEFQENWPHVTASRTGLTNVIETLERAGLKLDEVVYVTRTYLTKHGAGQICNEDCEMQNVYNLSDNTNLPNEWQGKLRYSKWSNEEDFIRAIREDKKTCSYPVKTSLMITHLNETDNKMLFKTNEIPLNDFVKLNCISKEIDNFYYSETKFADDIY